MSATRDARFGARVVRRTALRYAAGADAALDRPVHVRAGSALVRCATGELVVIQDDACFLAIVATDGTVTDVPLPSPVDGVRLFDDVRGNKKHKLDLEAAIAVGDDVLAFGSGSSPARESIVVVTLAAGKAPVVRIVPAHDLYAAMHAEPGFCGSELNVEGAAVLGDDLWFFQRGNGATRDGCSPIDATARVRLDAFLRWLDGKGPCPRIDRVTRWDLGSVGGARLTFTDGAPFARSRVAFLASAEESPDALRDGPVRGVVIGRLDPHSGTAEMGDVQSELGTLLVDKAEGLAFDPTDVERAFAVVDKDDPDAPAELLELALAEGWWSRA